MNEKKRSRTVKVLINIAIAVFIIVGVVKGFNSDTKPARFIDWTSSLTAKEIQLAEVSRYFGENTQTCVVQDYTELVDIFSSITDEDYSVRHINSENTDGYRLTLLREEKLWLFKAMDDGTVALILEDEVIRNAYGIEQGNFTIESPALWNYITETPDSIQINGDISASDRISSLEMREIRRVRTKADDIKPDENILIPLLMKSMDNIVNRTEELSCDYEICIETLYYIVDGEKIVLNAGTTEDYVQITYYHNSTGPQRFTVKDNELYEYVRGIFQREQPVDEAYQQYAEVIDEYMKNFITQSNAETGAGFTDYEICEFRFIDTLDIFSGHYEEHFIDVALYAENPMNIYDCESVWLDNNWRVRDYMLNIIFVVETKNDTAKYKFFPETSSYNKRGGSYNYIVEEFEKTDETIS